MPGDVVNRLLEFTLDANAKSIMVGTVKQYSVNTVSLSIALVDKGAAYAIPEGCRVTISTERPDGTLTMTAGTYEPGTNIVKHTMSTNELEQEGVHKSEVLVFGANKDLLVSSSFFYNLEKSNYDGAEIESQPQYPVLVTLITEIQSAITAIGDLGTAEAARVLAEQGRVSAESARVASELERISKEAERNQSYEAAKTAETERVFSENARKESETLRAQAEIQRESNETARNSAENLRKTAESARVQKIGEIETAENARVLAENQRQSAEGVRQTTFEQAENARENNEKVRKESENTRISAENARKNSESVRLNSENARISAEASREAKENERGQFQHKGNWESGTPYQKNNFVTHNGTSYIALTNTTNQNPASTPSVWRVIAAKGADGQGSGDMLTSVYDTTRNGVVDNSEKLGGFAVSHFATASALTAVDGKAAEAKQTADSGLAKATTAEQKATANTSEIASLKTGKASLASPAFTGTPTAPTQGVTNSSTRIATTAHVRSQRYISTINVPVSGWTSVTGDPTFKFKIKITANASNGSMTWLATRDVPHVYFDRASLKDAADAGITYAESVAGGLELYAVKTPSKQLTATVFVVRG